MFDWGEFHEVAQDLCELSSEGAYRSAVSRAYYSLFCSCRDWVAEQYSFTLKRGASAHDQLWDQFMLSKDTRLIAIGNEGDRLRAARNGSDYDTSPGVEKKDANRVVARVTWLFDKLADVRSRPPSSF